MKKSTLPLLIILAALAFGIPARWRLMEARRALLNSQARLAELQKQIAADESSFDSARREQERQNRERARVTAAVAKAQANLSKIDPESQWASPPASLPEWNPRSPYIWVTKDSLALLHPVALDKEGGLTRDAAAILAVDEETRLAMNAHLERAVADFRSLQLSNAQVTEQPSDGSAGGASVVSVQIAAMPEQGAAFRDQIEQILEQDIGDQRAGLVTNMAADWLRNFSGQADHHYRHASAGRELSNQLGVQRQQFD